MQTSTKRKNANRGKNVACASVTPLVFQADDGTSCYYRKAFKPLADSCPSKGNINATQQQHGYKNQTQQQHGYEGINMLDRCDQ